MSHYTVLERLRIISESGFKIAYDGCHKLYFLQTPAEETDAREIGYAIHQSSELLDLWEDTCFLRFVYPWDLEAHREHPWEIEQGAESDEDEEADS